MTRVLLVLIVATASLSGGCAALTNPVADGIPVRRLPAEVLGRPKADLRAIPLNALQQREPDPYRLDKGDVLAVIADNLIAPNTAQPPVKLPDQLNNTAALGYPIPVSDEGTISIPLLDPINVKGLSVLEAEQLLKDYAFGVKGGKQFLQPGQRLSVQLLQKRRYQITVVREDNQPVPVQTGSQVYGGNRRGNGYNLSLVAGENDVLHALNATGGPPGLDAKNEIVVLRNVKGKAFEPGVILDGVSRKQLIMNGDVVALRIPLRIYPEQALSIKEEDIILKEGDIVFIEARDTEVYYTSGLIGGGQYPLPRDYDLNVIQAIAQVRGPLLNGGFSQNAFVANSVGTGVGTPSPSLVTVLRQLPNGKQIPIRVDVNRAFIDPRERILILPGDIVVMQERPEESVGRYLSQTFRVSSTFDLLRSGSFNALGTSTNP